MAVAIVNKKQTGSTASEKLTLPAAATAGNLLIAGIIQTASASQPTLAGWTFSATKAEIASTSQFVWLATKIAAGGETEITVTPGAGGTIQAIDYFEVSGASETVDAIVKVDKNASAATVTSPGLTTTDAGDVVLAFVGASTLSGTIEAWSASNSAVPTAIETATTRGWGASYIPAATLSAVTITSKWTTAKVVGMLVVAIKPSGATSASRTAADTISVSDSVTVASAHPRAVGDTVSVSESAARQVALPRAVGDTVTVSESAARQVSVPRAVGDTVSVSESTSRKASFSRTAGDTVSVSDSAIGQLTKLVTAGDTVTVSDSASAVVTPGAGAVRASFAAATSDFVAAGVAAGAVAGPVGSGGTVQGVSVTGGHQ